MKGFNVTYEIITPESAEHGDAADRGFIDKDMTLRDAVSEFGGYGLHVEADCYPVSADNPPCWLTAYDYREDYVTGEHENRALHFPNTLTSASRLRIARLLGCYGV